VTAVGDGIAFNDSDEGLQSAATTFPVPPPPGTSPCATPRPAQLLPSGSGTWSLAADGGVFTAGDAPFAGSLAGRALRAPVTDIAGTPCQTGYDILAVDGGVFSFGAARFYG